MHTDKMNIEGVKFSQGFIINFQQNKFKKGYLPIFPYWLWIVLLSRMLTCFHFSFVFVSDVENKH